MTEIIDNTKVAEKMQNLLLEKNLTVEDLCKSTNLRKSAINSNLSGKSTFDIFTLEKISEVFDIPLQALLCQVNKDSKMVSKYESLVLQGIKEFKKEDFETYSIFERDIYGNTLIHYALNENDVEIVKYIIGHKIKFINSFDSNAPLVYLRLIKFMLENKLNDVITYIIEYTKIQKEFFNKDEIIDDIYKLIDKDNVLLQTIFNTTISLKSKLFVKRNYNLVSNKIWIKTIAKNHLDNALTFFLKNNEPLLFSYELIEKFSEHQYYNGLDYLLEKLDEPSIFYLTHHYEVLNPMLKTNNIDVVFKYLDKGFVKAINNIIIETINNDSFDLTKALLLNTII